jgi:hypothetical protein
MSNSTVAMASSSRFEGEATNEADETGASPSTPRICRSWSAEPPTGDDTRQSEASDGMDFSEGDAHGPP